MNSILERLKNTYFRAAKNNLEPMLPEGWTIKPEHHTTSGMSSTIRRYVAAITSPDNLKIFIVMDENNPTKLKFNRYGEFEDWDAAKQQLGLLIPKITKKGEKIRAREAVFGQVWAEIIPRMDAIWESNPNPSFDYVQSIKNPYPSRTVITYSATAKSALEGAPESGNVQVEFERFVESGGSHPSSYTHPKSEIKISIVSEVKRDWGVSKKNLWYSATSRKSNKATVFDRFFKIFQPRALSFEKFSELTQNSWDSWDIESNSSIDALAQIAAVFGVKLSDVPEVKKEKAETSSHTSVQDTRVQYPPPFFQQLTSDNPRQRRLGGVKIYTDYGSAGMVLNNQNDQVPWALTDNYALLVQLYDIPLKFQKVLPYSHWLEQDAASLMSEINKTFALQFAQMRSRRPEKVNPDRGRFESFETALDTALVDGVLNKAIKELKAYSNKIIAEGLKEDIFDDVKEVLQELLEDMPEVTVKPGVGKISTQGYVVIARLMKPGASMWVTLNQSGQIDVKAGGSHGKRQSVLTDDDLKAAILKWYETKPRKRRVKKKIQPALVQRPQSMGTERWPEQDYHKDVNDSPDFPRKIYRRETNGRAGPGGPYSPGKGFMLSIHASDDLIDYTGAGEQGKIPLGLYTGLDLHRVSNYGMRPGHIGWISGTYEGDTMYITECQSDLMQRTWDMIDREGRDADRSVGSGKKRQEVRSQNYRMRELSSQLKQVRKELAQYDQKEYGNIKDRYQLIQQIHDINDQLNSAKMRYKKFSRLPMYSQYKSQVENIFKNWVKVFYEDALDFAKEKGLSRILISSTSQIIDSSVNATLGKDPSSSVHHRNYDKVAQELGASPSPDGKWWILNLVNESISLQVDQVLSEAIYGNKATVFHKTTAPHALLSIAKWGFFPSLGGALGAGLYAVFDPSKSPSWANQRSYGSFVIKMAVDLSNKILILDYPSAKKFYGENYKLSDQLDQMGIKWRSRQDMDEWDEWEFGKTTDFSDIEKIVYDYDQKLQQPGQSQTATSIISNSSLRFDLNGIFFTGRHGHELIGFDASIFKPIAFAHMNKMPFNQLEWHKFNREGVEFIYEIAKGNKAEVPPLDQVLKQL